MYCQRFDHHRRERRQLDHLAPPDPPSPGLRQRLPHPAHARGRHSTTTSGSLRTRLTPTCPRFGPSFRRRPATRFAFWPRDGGTDEFSGVFAGRRNCASSSSSSRIFSSRRSIAASRSASSSCWRPITSPAGQQLQQLLAAQPIQLLAVHRPGRLTEPQLTPRLRRPTGVGVQLPNGERSDGRERDSSESAWVQRLSGLSADLRACIVALLEEPGLTAPARLDLQG